MGMPWRVTLSARSLEQGGVEVKRRGESERRILPMEEHLTLLNPALLQS